MKRFSTILIILILTSSCHSQKTYFEDGVIKTNGKTVENKKQGKWKYFYKNGNLKIEAEYLDDIPNGEWKFYYKNGNLKEVGFYSKENWTPFMERMRKSGSKNPEEHYLNKTGEWKEFYENGKLKKIGKYATNGTQFGEWIEYYENETIKKIYFFQNNGQITGNWNEYYNNGKLKKFRDTITGEWREYYENGNIKNSGIFPLNGLPTGEWIYYHNNGKLYQTQILSDGLRMEIVNCFDGNGKILDKGTLKNGNGTIKRYNIDGKLIETLKFSNGRIEE